MIYELEISEQADNDLRGIFEYIAFELQSPQISCLVIFKEQDTGTVKKLFEAFDIWSAPGKLFAGSYIVDYICLYNPICIGGPLCPRFQRMTRHGCQLLFANNTHNISN